MEDETMPASYVQSADSEQLASLIARGVLAVGTNCDDGRALQLQVPESRCERCLLLISLGAIQMLSGLVAVLAMLCSVANAQEIPAHSSSIKEAHSPAQPQAKPLIQTISHDAASAAPFQTQLLRTSAIINDSRLNDACCVGRFFWAVGENGVILTSDDAGASLSESILPFPCSLTSVSFLTNQIGYVAGSQFDSHSGWQKAVLLKTLDGGKSWEDLATGPAIPGATTVAAAELPPVSYIRFFDLEQGVCITEKSRLAPQAEFYRTSDGGLSWTRLRPAAKPDANSIPPEWSRATFTSAHQGILIGQQSATGTVIGDQLITLSPARRSLQAILDVTMNRDGMGWMVGDAASILKSIDGGLTWKTTDNAIDSDLAPICDLMSVCSKGSTVLIAGRPGNRILRSDDAGENWQAVSTSQTLPIHRLVFTGPESVVGIGAMGLVIRSEDRGQTWTTVRNPNYRASILSFCTDVPDVPLPLLTNLSSNEGFRSIVIQPSMRQDRGVASDLRTGRIARRRLAHLAVNDFCQDWMFARPNPGHAESSEEVLTSWQNQTDGQVIQQLPDRLAMWIRTWRPDVIVIDPIDEDDGVARWIREALPMACRIAAEEVPVSTAIQKSGMPAFSVRRIVQKTFDGRSAALSYSDNDVLGGVHSTVGLLVASARRSLSPSPSLTETESLRQQSELIEGRVSYEVLLDRGSNQSTSHLLAGFMAAPDSDSRRAIAVTSSETEEGMGKILQTVALQNGIAQSRIQRNEQSLGLIAELSEMNRNLPQALAIQQMEHLVETYRSVGNIDGQISVLKELVRRYPQSEAAVRSSVELFQYFSSEELRRSRKRKAALQIAEEFREDDPTLQQVRAQQRNAEIRNAGGIIKDVKQDVGQGTLLSNRIASEKEALDIQWNRNAADALKHLQAVAPAVLKSAPIRFQQAALLRRAGQIGRASSLLSEIARSESQMAPLAAAEIGVSSGASVSSVRILNIPPTENKPWLDALLDDDCWLEAEELHLKSTQEADGRSQSPCLVMMSWDDDHLYFAGRINRIAATPLDVNQATDRLRDVDHSGIDRFELALDIDRDYSSALVLRVDERGQTSDSCWHDRSWDPEWFVATESDESTWRFEIAIPINELVDRQVKPGQLWSIRMTRTAPGICRQVLVPRDQEFANDSDNGIGLLRFIRRKK